MSSSGVLKRSYTEEIPDDAKYKTPQASIPARRTQVKLTPDGKTSFGQNEIIRIIIPPQGYFDPEYSYLSFNIELTAPETYRMKALEVWNDDSNVFVYDGKAGIKLSDLSGTLGTAGFNDIVMIGRPKLTTPARVVPFVRHTQDIANKAALDNTDYLFEWVPSGQVYPVLPFSAHGFFTRVVLRTANNTPIEDIQDYDYLTAHLGSLLQSNGYADTMGAMLEGWGDVNTRAKMGLACVKNLTYIKPVLDFEDTTLYDKDVGGNYIPASQIIVPSFSQPYSVYDATTNPASVRGLSPEGIDNEIYMESYGGLKFTCNMNLGLFQQNQNLPLLFSGGLILELYTAPFERCISFTSVYSKIDPVDFPNLRDSEILGDGLLVDVSAQNCVLPIQMTNQFKWNAEEIGTKLPGEFLDKSHCGYAYGNMRLDDRIITDFDETSSDKNFLSRSRTEDFRLAEPNYQNAYYYGPNVNNKTQVAIGANVHKTANQPLLASRMNQFTSGWSYELTKVELRADMLQFSQSYDEGIAEIVDSDEGLPITFQTFSTQKTVYDGQRMTLTLNERARSIQFAMAVFKDPTKERKTHEFLLDDDSRFVVACKRVLQTRLTTPEEEDANVPPTLLSTKFVSIANPFAMFARILPIDGQEQALFPNLIDYQFRIGTRFIPASPVDCTSGAVQAYIELMKAIGMYGSFSGTGERANMPGNRITPDMYSKRICTAASRTLAGAYYKVSGQAGDTVRSLVFGNMEAKDYVGSRYRVPQKFILGQNFSDIPSHAAGVDTATQALSIELALNGAAKSTDITGSYNCYVFLNVRRDMFVRCGGQIEILY